MLVAAALSVVGAASLRLLNISYKPVRQERTVAVSYSVKDASPQAVEAEVTSRIEGVLSGLSGCRGTSSVSRTGSGSVTVKFDRRKDMQEARFEIASAVRNIYPGLPPSTSYPSISLDSRGVKSGADLTLLVKGRLPSEELAKFAQSRICEPLSRLPQVERLTVNGGSPYRWAITFDSDRATACGVAVSEIKTAIRDAFRDESLGRTLTEDGNLLAVRLSVPEEIDFGAIPVRASDGRVFHLSDFASWKYVETPPASYRRINGLNSVSVDVSTVSQANLIESVRAVKRELAAIERGLPDGISIAIGYDSSEYVVRELDKIYLRTSLCLVILLLLVVLVNRSWRSAVIMALSLAVNMLIAIAIYAVLRIPVHIYTLAGITVSLGVIIDSSVIMTDHYARNHDRRAIADLAEASLTTIAALFMIFLLPESERVNLSDFIYVIAINLCVSLLVAFFFIPALMEYIPVNGRRQRSSGLRVAVRWNRAYSSYIGWSVKHRYVHIISFLVLFGLSFSWFYTSLDRSDFYREPERRTLQIRAGMPDGCSVSQLDSVVRPMENFLASFEQISVFTTSIRSAQDARISVEFKPEFENSSFPSRLKTEVIAMASNYGGAGWSVCGIDERSFSNNVISPFKSDAITLKGYNYEELLLYAEILRERLLKNRRFMDPQIWNTGWDGAPKAEFVMDYDFERMALLDISPEVYFSSISQLLCDEQVTAVPCGGETVPVILRSSTADSYDLWHLENIAVEADSARVALSEVGNIAKKMTGLEIRKSDQSFELNVCYDFAGSRELHDRLCREHIDYMNENVLPVGFKASNPYWGWFNQHKDWYFWLIALIVLVIYVMLAVSFESLKLPLAIVFMIPFSFIGLFLVFGLSNLTFDQGGFAACIMLCGITVNAGIYLVNCWRSFGSFSLRNYLRAFNRKVKPIMLTIVSTVAGLAPFLSDGPAEVFWFDFAAGAIGGLLFSIPVLVFALPVFAVPKKDASRLSPDEAFGFYD